jgi:glycosyltransferase involved in cell wall biosynthesis
MKRILIFSLAYYPSHVSGAETAIKDTTDRIDPSDIEFHLITHLFDPAGAREETIGNVHVHRVGFGGAYLSKILFVPLAALKARALHHHLRFDAMWTMMTYMLFPTMLAKWIGVRVPHALSLQDGDPYDKVFNRWFIRPVVWILNSGFRRAKVIQAISHYLAAWPAKRGYHGTVEIIYDGANPRDLKTTPDTAEVERVRKELGKKPGDIFLVNTARLVHQKGADTTIRALTSLPEHVKLVLVGGGPEEPMLKSLARELGVGDRVIFTGPVDRTVVTLYRQACDIFVGPSRSEGQGHAFNSAMASRLPVVTTQEGGLAEFVFDEKRNPDMPTTAWAVDADEPEQIAEAVKDIIAHPDKVKKVTETARALMLEKFDWDAIAKQMRKRVFGAVLSETER